MQSPSNEFDAVLDEIETSLTEARGVYDTITETDTAPETFLQAITELEDQAQGLSTKTRVSEADLALAEQTRVSAELLAEALLAFQNRQRLLAERSVARLDYWIDGLARIPSQSDLPESIEETISELQRQHTILEKLVDAEEYAQVVLNDRVSLSGIELQIRAVDAELRVTISDATYSSVCLEVLDSYFDQIHDALGSLTEENPQRTAYREELQTVKGLASSANSALDSGDDQLAAETARVALEGGVMVELLVTRAEIYQRLAESLGQYLLDHDFASEATVRSHVQRGDPDELVAIITDAIGTEIETSVETRIRRLLEESDGSLRSTINRTELDEETVLEHILQMYTDKGIADIVVEFDK